MTMTMTLGQVLAAARGSRSLRAMAQLTGIDHSLLAKIEKDEVALPRKDTMQAIARGYRIDIDFLARVAYLGGQSDDDQGRDDTLRET